MSDIYLANSGVISVTNGVSAFGSLTDLMAAPVKLKSIKVNIQLTTTLDNGYVQIYVGGLAYGPLLFMIGTVSLSYDIPLKIPMGAQIAAEGWSTGASSTKISIIGTTADTDISQISSSLTTAFAFPTYPAAAWTALSTVPALLSMPLKYLKMVMDADNTAAIGSLNLGIGTSATSVSTIAEGIVFGSQENQYTWREETLRMGLTAGGYNLYAYPTNTCRIIAYAGY